MNLGIELFWEQPLGFVSVQVEQAAVLRTAVQMAPINIVKMDTWVVAY